MVGIKTTFRRLFLLAQVEDRYEVGQFAEMLKIERSVISRQEAVAVEGECSRVVWSLEAEVKVWISRSPLPVSAL